MSQELQKEQCRERNRQTKSQQLSKHVSKWMKCNLVYCKLLAYTKPEADGGKKNADLLPVWLCADFPLLHGAPDASCGWHGHEHEHG